MRTLWRRPPGLGRRPGLSQRSAWYCFSQHPCLLNRGTPPGKTQSKSFNGLHQRHRPRLVTRHGCCGGFDVAFGECGSKRILAGVVFGVGMAIAAVNFLAWLFPGA